MTHLDLAQADQGDKVTLSASQVLEARRAHAVQKNLVASAWASRTMRPELLESG